MATKVHMEALSPTMEEGQVVKWLKSEGDEVSQGEVLAEIETDKATMELSARGAGVLRKILVQEGGTAPVGQVIAVIAGVDEDISGDVEETPAGEPEGEGDLEKAREKQAGAPTQLADGGDREEELRQEAAAGGRDAGGRVKASPLARRLAEDAGLDLSGIRGSGPGGRIVKRDVEEARQTGAGAPAVAPSLEGPEYEDVPVSQMRKTIARRLAESIGPVPTFYLTVEVDADRVIQARQRINESLEERGEKVSVNDIVLKATAAALRRHPEVNAQWHGDRIRRFNAVHLGVAVAVEEGLITPVVRDAERKGLVRIGAEVREMAGRAREKKLKPEEYTGATFSVSNLGMFGIHEFTAIINPPEAGILAVGAVEERPVVVDGQVVVRPRMRITMSCDHRVVDGAMGARFLQTLRTMLEEPAAILI